MAKTKLDNFISTIADKHRQLLEKLVEGKERYKTEYYEMLIHNEVHRLINELKIYDTRYRTLSCIVPGYGTKAGDTTKEQLGWTYLGKTDRIHLYDITEQGKEILDAYKQFCSPQIFDE